MILSKLVLLSGFLSAPFVQAHPLRARGDEPPVPNAIIIEGCKRVAQALGGATYAIAGGAAVVMLGSERETGDIDIAIPRDATTDTKRALLAGSAQFSLVQPQRAMWYTSTSGEYRLPVEVVAPGLIDFEFDDATPVKIVDGVKVVHPAIILNTKCKLRRGAKDDLDISFLVRWLLGNGEPVTVDQIPNCVGVRAAIPLIGAAGQ